MAEKFRISRAAVWKQIKMLEREGCKIEAVRSKGYRLVTMPDIIVLDDVKHELKTTTIGKDIRYYSEVDSTNTLAMKLAQDGASEGTVVIAETQHGGKGRLGRRWFSPRGNLLLSIILRPVLPTHKAPLITLLGGVAVAAAIREHLGIAAGIKWPNDILIRGKKVCGLLAEMSAEPDSVRYIVLGIGLNVNMDSRLAPAEIQGMATTLAAERGGIIDRTRLFAELLAQIDRWYRIFCENPEAVLSAWRNLSVTLGRRVAAVGQDGTIEGVAEDIDSEGRLMVRLDSGVLQRIASGDVTIRKDTKNE